MCSGALVTTSPLMYTNITGFRKQDSDYHEDSGRSSAWRNSRHKETTKTEIFVGISRKFHDTLVVKHIILNFVVVYKWPDIERAEAANY